MEGGLLLLQDCEVFLEVLVFRIQRTIPVTRSSDCGLEFLHGVIQTTHHTAAQFLVYLVHCFQKS
jgi:hypothetical protein